MEALRAGDSEAALTDVLQRNGVTSAGKAGELAGAVRRYQALFAGQSDTEILSGGFACGGNEPAV
ncbi:MAG: hypothetical protein B7Z22_01715 [Hyphomonas sp. 32-62-5]|nr:MAG: hypothetical protein B7Z22_01715 [Hyphomonas sp. 32-62-5]